VRSSPARDHAVADAQLHAHLRQPPDHLAAGEAALCAVYPDSRNPFAHPELLEVEGLEPYSVAEVWLSAVAGGSPDVKALT